ncbi:hypothetical protein JK359_38200 [Streptomyces actinomycinicus]|uniref:Condensation domain-containing protein n=1 Tax=Streptomyces actinomycinicus TaxID=1695166 RepID=A0A937EQG9_9ACTN|nr:condensation domain-containing protein [Streptomyces actinomycinicus]MBL1087697.1 hypothetical protein [Streptomyces actinomycinicus]
MPPDIMTVHPFPRAPLSVVVEPGPPPYPAPWDLELRGPLDEAALEQLLDELTAGDPDLPGWRHRLLRHGPDHHTLRFSVPQGGPAAWVAGRIADRLTGPPDTAGRPQTPAQCAALARAGEPRYDAVVLDVETAADAGAGAGEGAETDADADAVADAVRGAVRALAAVHPQLRSRLDAGDGWLDAADGIGADGEKLPFTEGEFADEADFAALVDSVTRTLDPRAGVQLRVLLARDRRPAGRRADRIAVVAHEAAVDAASWHILLDDLTTALGTTGGPGTTADLGATSAVGTAAGSDTAADLGTTSALGTAAGSDTAADLGTTTAVGTAAVSPAVRPQPVADGLAGWVAELRELAGDSAEAQHWALVAERRSEAAGVHGFAPYAGESRRDTGRASLPADGESRTNARVAGPGDAPAAVPAHAGDSGFPLAPGTGFAPEGDAGDVRRTGFVLDADATERITQELGPRLALTTGQVLTGVFALALARWQDTDEACFDVRSDPRAARPDLRRCVGRLAEPYPVQLGPGPGPDALGQLTALAGPLAVCAGRAEGGAGFGACREWSPDPALRRTLRDLAPAWACLSLDDPGGPLPGSARPLTGAPPGRPGSPDAPGRSAYRLEARAHVRDGRLHIGLDWVSDHAYGITDTSVAALEQLLRELLEELAAVPAAPMPRAFRATPQQSALYTGGDARPGTGRHVEQLVWVWRGPLDLRRFTASWQSVFDRETVLRTAFSDGSEPLLVVHERVVPEITRRAFPDADWSAFLERDRLRGFDLRRPGALRLTLLETERPRPADPVAPPTRILVTYHRALLDTWSAHLLLREFYRAYLAGGSLSGGERRPDLRDYTAWAAAQDPEPARGFWTRSAPPEGAASRPVRSAARAGLTGVGRARLRLDPAETSRLAHWAGTWGTAESSVLQAVWAMLIYRASGATGPAPVCFAVTVSGRGIALEGVARMPGPLRNPLPMTVEVDPAGTVPRLLRQLRDLALDMAAYEWVPADWIRAWSRGGADPDTVIVFEDPPHPLDGLETQLAAQGIHAELPDTLPARSVLPIGLLAHHDSTGGLVLVGVHDRALLDEDAAAELLAQSALLLRSLPMSAGETTTVGEALALLAESAAPPPAEAAEAGRPAPLVTLRAARRERAGTICLIPPPGASDTCYDLLAGSYPGPQELLVLPAGADADGARAALEALAAGRPLLLAGFSGAGVPACDLARRIAADGGRPPRVVIAGAGTDEQERAGALVRALQGAAPHA